MRVYDIRDQYRPIEVGAMVPRGLARLIDSRPNRAVVLHFADVFVIVYCTDWSGAGLYIMAYTGSANGSQEQGIRRSVDARACEHSCAT
jgi:hypothetical protein